MMSRALRQMMSRCLAPAAMVLALGAALPAHALQFTLSAQSGDTWTYTLTYDPLDNYAIPGLASTATIRLTGLSGVTSAGLPTSTDFDDAWISNLNKAWSPTVLDGGTAVEWTHIGPGTGNFDVPKHVFGFTVTAPGAVTGTAHVVTNGFSTDIDRGAFDRDISAAVAGPVPEPESLALALGGLGVVGAFAWRRQRAQR